MNLVETRLIASPPFGTTIDKPPPRKAGKALRGGGFITLFFICIE